MYAIIKKWLRHLCSGNPLRVSTRRSRTRRTRCGGPSRTTSSSTQTSSGMLLNYRYTKQCFESSPFDPGPGQDNLKSEEFTAHIFFFFLNRIYSINFKSKKGSSIVTRYRLLVVCFSSKSFLSILHSKF